MKIRLAGCLILIAIGCFLVCEAILMSEEKCVTLIHHEAADIQNMDLWTFNARKRSLNIDLSQIVRVETCDEKKKLLKIELVREKL